MRRARNFSKTGRSKWPANKGAVDKFGGFPVLNLKTFPERLPPSRIQICFAIFRAPAGSTLAAGWPPPERTPAPRGPSEISRPRPRPPPLAVLRAAAVPPAHRRTAALHRLAGRPPAALFIACLASPPGPFPRPGRWAADVPPWVLFAGGGGWGVGRTEANRRQAVDTQEQRAKQRQAEGG